MSKATDPLAPVSPGGEAPTGLFAAINKLETALLERQHDAQLAAEINAATIAGLQSALRHAEHQADLLAAAIEDIMLTHGVYPWPSTNLRHELKYDALAAARDTVRAYRAERA